jgi:deoxyribonuclease V
MEFYQLHKWNLNQQEAVQLQKELSAQICRDGTIHNPHFIGGADVSVDRSKSARAAVSILNYPELKIVEEICIEGIAEFPYIPGLLSFREIPLLLEAFRKINCRPDLIIIDGQGIAHPRKIGLASHLGLILDMPTIGCAKSHLYGDFSEPGIEAGEYSFIKDTDDNVIGSVLRTKENIKPLFISSGHKISLTDSIHWVLQCCRGYRLPEPIRQAHYLSKINIKSYSGQE